MATPAQTNQQKTQPVIQGLTFPYEASKGRIDQYAFYQKIFEGQHFEAFSIKIDSEKFTKEYGKLKYIVANFGGLISKVVADMLFSEPPKITVPDGDQEWVDGLIEENKLHIQNYESALSNSAIGDALYKMRTGDREESSDEQRIFIEDITPSIYFPLIQENNVRGKPTVEELAWVIKIGDKKYLRKEIHEPGKITNKLYLLENEKIMAEVDLSLLGNSAPPKEVDTGVNFNLIYHTPNWKTGRHYFGVSDYADILTLIYALNNRLTKVDNILDKHSDPILALPEGVLDEKGKVKRSSLHMFEVPAGSGEKPEYVVWNASLEAAFSEIDKLVEFMFMFSEISPDSMGMGKGQSDSGRALKLKLMRTIAKTARKRLYYDQTLKDLIFDAQVLGKEHGIKINGKTLSKEPVRPEIEWFDGLPIDQFEQVQLEEMKISAGLSSEEDSIMRIEGVDEDSAKNKAKEIREGKQIKMVEMGFSNIKKPAAKDDTLSDKKEAKPAQ